MKGSTYKRCKCRDAGGKELGAKCPKLRRKDGSWNPRHGTWYFLLELEAGENAARRRMRRGGFATDTDAQAALDAAKATVSRGVDPAARSTVGDYLTKWIAGRRTIRRTTTGSYSDHIRLYLIPHLGHIELGRLRVHHVAEMFEAIEAKSEAARKNNDARKRLEAEARDAWKAGDRDAARRAREELAGLPPHRRPVGATTMHRIRATLRIALASALREGLVAVNVAALAELDPGKHPKAVVWTPDRVKVWQQEFDAEVEAARGRWHDPRVNGFQIWVTRPRPSKVMVWTPEQTGRFLDHIAGLRLYPLYHLFAFTGLRRGEACGLEWADVDLVEGAVTIRIQRFLVSYDEIEEDDPKSEASKDTVALDAGTVQVLRTWRARQDEEREQWGEAWVPSGKVFTRENGEALHPRDVSRTFARQAFNAGLPPIRLHDLRHGAATLLLAGGADMKVVQATLRHSSISMTADTYTEVLSEVARQAAEAAAALVPRAVRAGE